MAVTGAKKSFPPPISKPPGWVNPPNTQPDDAIASRPHLPKPIKPWPVFPGAPIQPPPGAIVIDDGPNLKWPVGNREERPMSFVSTEDAAKIEPAAPANQANNNMIAGNSRNAIHGEKNNALQGGQPENGRESDIFNKYADIANGAAPAIGIAAANGVAAPICKSPRKSPANVWRNGSWVPSVGNIWNGAGCGCYVSTGLDPMALLSLVGAGVLAKLGLVFRKIRGVRKAKAILEDKLDQLVNRGKNLFMTNHRNMWLAQNPGKKYGAAQAADAALQHRKAVGDTTAQLREFARLEKLGVETIPEADSLATMMDKEMMKLAAYGGGSWIAASAIFATAGNIYDNFTLFREKTCRGDNTVLNETTCECECTLDDGGAQVANLGSSEYQTQAALTCEPPAALAFVQGLVQDLIDEIPGFNGVFSGDEVQGCYACTCLQTQKQSLLGYNLCECECVPPDLAYGNGPCQHGRDFDSDTCCCYCPEGSHLAEGLSPSGQNYARLDDNLGTVAPSAFHESYSTGCNYVCDGREADSSNMISPWPPVCPADYIFDSSALVCKCIPCPVRQYTCTDAGTAVSCDDCPPGYTCDPGDPENGISAGCAIVTEVGSAVESSEDCEALLGFARSGQWGAGWYCVS